MNYDIAHVWEQVYLCLSIKDLVNMNEVYCWLIEKKKKKSNRNIFIPIKPPLLYNAIIEPIEWGMSRVFKVQKVARAALLTYLVGIVEAIYSCNYTQYKRYKGSAFMEKGIVKVPMHNNLFEDDINVSTEINIVTTRKAGIEKHSTCRVDIRLMFKLKKEYHNFKALEVLVDRYSKEEITPSMTPIRIE